MKREPLTILTVCPEWPPHVIGGGGYVYQRLAQGYLAGGDNVIVAHGCYVEGAPSKTTEGLRVIPVRVFDPPNMLRFARSATPPFPGAAKTLRKLLDRKIDVAHLHGVGFPLVDLAARILVERRVPYIFTIHGVPTTPFEHGAALSMIAHRYLAGARRTKASAFKTTAISRALRFNAHFPAEDAEVIHNGIDLPTMLPAHATQRPSLVVSLSRLSSNKGLDLLIRAVSRLYAAGLDVALHLYGADAGEGSSLRRLANELLPRERFEFRGQVASERIADILSRAAVLAVPSRVEGFGLVALEALANGVPLVSSLADGLADFVSTDVAEVVDPLETATLEIGLRRALEAGRASPRVRAGLKRAAEFGWEPVVSRYRALLLRASDFQPARFA